MAVKSTDMRLVFVEIIDGIFGKGVLGDNQPYNINSDVMVLINQLLYQLRVSNEKMDEFFATMFTVGFKAALTGAYLYSQAFRGAIKKVLWEAGPNGVEDLLPDFLSTKNVREFFTGLRNDRNYLLILNNLARTYKSQMALALNGLW